MRICACKRRRATSSFALVTIWRRPERQARPGEGRSLCAREPQRDENDQVRIALAGCPGGSCGPIAGLTDCTTDDDCKVVPGIGCCTCTMGVREAAVNRSKLAEISQRAAVCCGGILCAAVYVCEDHLGARCDAGTCELTRPATPVSHPTPTPAPGTIALPPCQGRRAFS
jgi:hypothetical protein